MNQKLENNTKEKSEYCIYQINRGGQPFIYHIYDNLENAKLDLYNLISLEKERNRPYYVNNDFYENEYTPNISSKYFCIRKRTVTQWENYSKQKEKQEQENTENKMNKNNLILFENYI